MSRPRIGIFSGYDPRPWVMAECAEHDIEVLAALVARLSKLGKYEIVWPGAKLEGHDKLCATPEWVPAITSESVAFPERIAWGSANAIGHVASTPLAVAGDVVLVPVYTWWGHSC